MARQQAENPLTSGCVSPADIVDHARAVVQMLEETVGSDDIQLSDKGALGLHLTLRCVRSALDEAIEQFEARKEAVS